jgi:RsiW-degrading membrane proteinase PrsW (M82 family)
VSDILRIPLSLIPVLGFLTALLALDSYKLVPLRSTIQSILLGAVAAILCLWINARILDLTNLSVISFTRYGSPIIEETAKALFVVYLIRSNRLSFMVDAAIRGFAVGAGFALAENVYYLLNLSSQNLVIWIIRGFGTAAIHPTTMVIFALVSKSLADRHGERKLWIYLPGLAGAIVLHSLFNHFVFSPVITTMFLLLILPAFIILVFDRSEKVTRRWLGLGFDTDQEILEILDTGRITDSRIGRYLEALRERLPDMVVADIFCLLRLHTELAMRAKGVLMLRQAGVPVQRDPEVKAKLAELSFLERSIGKTGLLAIRPFLRLTSHELAQLHQVK